MGGMSHLTLEGARQCACLLPEPGSTWCKELTRVGAAERLEQLLFGDLSFSKGEGSSLQKLSQAACVTMPPGMWAGGTRQLPHTVCAAAI